MCKEDVNLRGLFCIIKLEMMIYNKWLLEKEGIFSSSYHCILHKSMAAVCGVVKITIFSISEFLKIFNFF